MTSKSSFLVRSKENHKRRIWVWVVSFLTHMAVYPGILTMYLSRVRYFNAEGYYKTAELFKEQLQQAMTDSLGFQPRCIFSVTILGILIAVQGFSYLYSRKKVDMYHSVPIPAKSRFAVIYLNGLLIYFVPYMLSLLTAVIMASVQGAFSVQGLAECGLAIVMNVLYFLAVYNTSILAVMLTGNIVITGFAVFTLLFISEIGSVIFQGMKHSFFTNSSSYYSNVYDGRFFSAIGIKFSVVPEYWEWVQTLKNQTLLSKIIVRILPLYVKWFIYVLILFALAYFCYKIRPSEATGKAIAFRKLKPFLKIVISSVVGLGICYFAFEDGIYSASISIAAFLLGTLLCCGVMEAIFEFDIRAVIKHPLSTGISVCVVTVVFCIYQFDIFGYDTYIPDAEKVESVAMDLGSYQYHWNLQDDSISFISQSEYLKNTMFITDVDAVCALAEKGRNIAEKELPDGRRVCVLYRLKSGREVERSFTIDLADDSNRELLNRIVGTQEYREGWYQIVKDSASFEQHPLLPYYSNGTVEWLIPPEEMLKLREAWLKDMETYDFSLVRDNRACGEIKFIFQDTYQECDLPVYENFTNTIDVLKENEAYYPVELCAEDIAYIEVTRHLVDETNDFAVPVYDTGRTVRASWEDTTISDRIVCVFEDPEEINEIAAALYPNDLSTYWTPSTEFEDYYDISVVYKPGTDSYARGDYYYSYNFINGRIPDFLEEKMAYEAGEQ